MQHREKGGKHHGRKTKLFHINVICGLKTESCAALGASGQICLLCNAPSSLAKMSTLKHKSFSEKRLIKGQPAQSDSNMTQRTHAAFSFITYIYLSTEKDTHSTVQVDTTRTHNHTTQTKLNKHMHMQ